MKTNRNLSSNANQKPVGVKQALAGLKVVEYGQFISAPYCAKLLADLGAEVIKIEEPGAGDNARALGPFWHNIPHPEQSGLFCYLNTNKLGVTLNVKTAGGRRIFDRLLAETDILVENNSPRLMKRWKLGYANLSKINPRLIMTSITPFGQTGPYRDYKGCDLTIYHASGTGNTTPSGAGPGREPLKSGGRLTDFYAGQTAALATMCAIFAREKTKKGQHIDISAQECFLNNVWASFPAYLFKNSIPTRSERRQRVAPMGLLPCKDGYVSFQFSSGEPQWRSLVEVMDNPAWAENELFKDQYARGENWDALKPLMVAWLSQHTKQEFFHAAQAHRCPVGPVNTMEEVVNCPHLASREFLADIEIPGVGKVKAPSAPYKFSETPWRIGRPAPLLGQHNEDIYCQRLGYTKQALTKMRADGVI